MDTDKAYLLGLIIGGGVFGTAEDVFRIRLPYKKWGSYTANPQRAGQIARDILQKVGQMFRAIYNLSVQYEATPGGTWTILCEGDVSSVRDDLTNYGIVCEGEIKENASISAIIPELIDNNLKRRFIAGLADTIGSMAQSQRRFSAEHQILSFEIKGYNFQFVCDLCKLLYSINCIPDQVNWNHPNIHCANNPYYAQWNKGFKLRILLDQYSQFGAFAFRTKAESSNENRQLQQQTHTDKICEERDFRVTPSTIHPAENDPRLPDNIRGGHYIHFRHFCAVMGCEHAPYDKVCRCFENLGDLIIPFPILCKDSNAQIESIIQSSTLLSNRNYTVTEIVISSLYNTYQTNPNALIYGDTDISGYPITEVIQAIAYIIAKDNELYGKRPKKYKAVIERCITENPNETVTFHIPDLLTPLAVFGNGRGALIGAKNPVVYNRLITRDPSNEYKLLVRQITEEDLTNVGE